LLSEVKPFLFSRENYIFHCRCTKCEQESTQPDVTSSEEEDDCDDEDQNLDETEE